MTSEETSSVYRCRNPLQSPQLSTLRAYQCFHLSSILLTNAVAWCCVFGKNDGDVREAVALGKMLLIEVRSLITPAVLPVAPSCFTRAVRKNERGLLHGIEDVSNAHEYSRRMISDDATALLRDRKHMCNCALKDTHGDVKKFMHARKVSMK